MLDMKVKNYIGLVIFFGVKLFKVKVGVRYNWKKFIDFD